MTLLLIAILFFAQQLDPLFAVAAYTTADPNNADRLGLATPNGRFSVTPSPDCQGFAPGQNVLIYPNWAFPPWLGVSRTDMVQPACAMWMNGRMSETPCFTNDAGDCDVTAESD